MSVSRNHHHHHHHLLGHSTRRSHACSGSKSNTNVSLVINQRRRPKLNILQGELRKIKPPSFDGDHRKREDVEAWLFGMGKYFKLHDYSSNVEAKIAIYHIQRNGSIWWDQLK